MWAGRGVGCRGELEAKERREERRRSARRSAEAVVHGGGGDFQGGGGGGQYKSGLGINDLVLMVVVIMAVVLW